MLTHSASLTAAQLSVESARELLDVSRTTLLTRLKSIGIDRLKDRQDIANILGRTRRLAALNAARAAKAEAGAGPEQWQVRVEGATVHYEKAPVLTEPD